MASLPDGLRAGPPEDWTAEDWEAHRARAAAYLAIDPGWIVGPAVVAMFEAGRDRARAAADA